MYAFKVPDIGEGVVEAEILEWHVAEGDHVAEDQLLVELLTDKAEIEIPSPKAGTIVRLHFEVGETAQVGDVLIEIDDSAAAPGPVSEGKREPASAPVAAPSTPAAIANAPVTADARPRSVPESDEAAHRPPPMPARPRGRPPEPALSRSPSSSAVGVRPIQAVPAVRELAKRLGVDLAALRGSGPRGRIMRRDVEAYASGRVEPPQPEAAPLERVHSEAPSEARAPDPDDWVRQPLRGLRRTISERMSLSRRTAAHFTYVDEVDMTALLADQQDQISAGASPLAYIARACVLALADFPILNASIDDARGDIVLKGKIHLGIAAATDHGLVVPVIRDAGELDVPSLSQQIRRLAEGARGGSLGPGELRGSTFTITSLGKLGGVISTPILNPPEVAILGVNAIRSLPRCVEGEIVERKVMNLSLSVDHRIADGMVAAQYIQAVRRLLEAPASLLRDMGHA